MFSAEALRRAAEKWRAILARVPFARSIDLRIQAVENADEREALRILYASSPLSDWGNYDFSIFQSTAAHAVFLKKTSALPEEIFISYVLPLRVNEEALSDCRAFFHSQLAARIQDLPPERAALEINYWCAENMTYRSTDTRTISALDAYRSAFGRCGEESTLLVNALRACGFAARQIYTPRWTHCDDNHAWVEVLLNGEWRFMGACEPEEVLDRAWFNSAAGRAMLIHSRVFGEVGSVDEGAKDDAAVRAEKTASGDSIATCAESAPSGDFPEIRTTNAPSSDSPVSCAASVSPNPRIGQACADITAAPNFISRLGAVDYLNQTARYAAIDRLTVRVANAQGAPIAGAETVFGILNMSEIYPAARTFTDSNGEAHLDCGKGSLFIQVRLGNRLQEKLIDTRSARSIQFTFDELGKNDLLLATTSDSASGWRDFAIHAPIGDGVHMPQPTPEQRKRCEKRNAEANRLRAARVRAMFDSARTERLIRERGYRPEIRELLKKSRGNFDRLCDFLAAAPDPNLAQALLETLSEKDLRDITPAVLEDALHVFFLRDVPNNADAFDFLARYVLCPRVANEMLLPVRARIQSMFSESERRTIAENPERIREFIRANIAFAPDLEYDALITAPAAALETRFASPRAQDILFVAICRALGVPARLNPIDSQPEYYSNGAFLPPHPRTANLAITASGVNPKYFEDFTIARLGSDGYVSLDLTGVPLGTAIPVLPGDYRILTSNRLPNGDVHMSALAVSLLPDERKSVELHFFAATTEEMLGDCPLSDFSLSSDESLSSITEGGAILMRLEPGAEPTEHLLGELLSQADAFDSLCPIFIVSGAARENELFSRVQRRFPNAPIVSGGADGDWALLAREVFVDPEKLPLAIVADRSLHAVYAASGYNVGLAAMLAKIAKLA